jgi:hypothetical protein
VTPATVPVLERCASAGWSTVADVAVVVSTHGRRGYLPGLLAGLDAQDHPGFQVLVVDNGSRDGTWEVLTGWLRSTSLPALGLRVGYCDSPAVPRNTAVAATAAAALAFTDDDCLPSPGWLAALTGALTSGVHVVQGQTVPETGGWGGPWGRSLTVTDLTGLYETANLACRTEDFRAVGGFASERLLTGRPFGEDVLLGAALARLGRAAFCADALVEHRVLPGGYRDFLRERHRLRGFPLLRKAVPELGDRALGGIFLSTRTATADLGVAAVVASLASRRSWPLLLALPWASATWRAAAHRPERPRVMRAAQLAVGDVVGLAGLVEGSCRARRLLL